MPIALFYNVTTAIAMMAGRFGLALPALMFAGMLARQTERPQSQGTLRTDTFTFGALLTTFLVIVTALSYLPVLTLGPVLEHYCCSRRSSGVLQTTKEVSSSMRRIRYRAGFRATSQWVPARVWPPRPANRLKSTTRSPKLARPLRGEYRSQVFENRISRAFRYPGAQYDLQRHHPEKLNREATVRPSGRCYR